MFVQMSPAPKKGKEKDEDIERILKDVESILRNSPTGTGFALHLVTAPAPDVLNLVSTMRRITPTLDDIQKEVPSAQEYKVIPTPKLVFTGERQMTIPAPPGK